MLFAICSGGSDDTLEMALTTASEISPGSATPRPFKLRRSPEAITSVGWSPPFRRGELLVLGRFWRFAPRTARERRGATGRFRACRCFEADCCLGNAFRLGAVFLALAFRLVDRFDFTWRSFRCVASPPPSGLKRSQKVAAQETLHLRLAV